MAGLAHTHVHRRVRREPKSLREIANKLTCIDSLKPSLDEVELEKKKRGDKKIQFFTTQIKPFKRVFDGEREKKGKREEELKDMR